MDRTLMRVAQLQDLTDVAVERLTTHGESMVSFSLQNHGELMPLKFEVCRRAQILEMAGVFFRTHGEDEGWQNVERATFFRPTHLKHASVPQKIASVVFPSRLYLPIAHKLGLKLSKSMRLSAKNSNRLGKLSDSTLLQWKPNRVGINLMDGSDEDPAEIPKHIDTKDEIGAVVVFDVFKRGLDQNSFIGEHNESDSNPAYPNVTVIFGKDVCDSVGVPQAEHSVVSDLFRLSVTFAELKPSLVKS